MAEFDAARWDRRFSEEGWRTEPSPYLVSQRSLLPAGGRALDVAGGPGRNAVWLAGCGLEVTVADFSTVALEMARARAAEAGVSFATVRVDLVTEPLPAGPWDVIACFRYLQRDLFPRLEAALVPGGLLIAETATVRNLERHERPPREHVLDEGELPTLVPALEVIHSEEGWFDDQHIARIVARRPG